jgi:homocysteine S-methyltransferase
MARGLNREQAEDVLRLSVRLAKEARDEFLASEPDAQARDGINSLACASGSDRIRLVAASIGSYGASLHDGSEYRGDYGLSVRQLIEWHRPRLEILADTGADLIACETIPSLAEGEALVKLLGEFPEVSAWLSFSCRDEHRLCHGEPFVEAVQLANDAPNIVAVGVNCTSPRFIDGLLTAVADVAKKPLVVYPNSGETWDAARHCWHGTSTEPDWSESVRRWRKAGARLIGGCCRTTPETIRQIAAALC